MKKIGFALLSVLLSCSSVFAIEDVTLSSPITQPSTTRWRVDEIHLYVSNPNVSVTFLDPDTGKTVTCSASGAAATSLLSTLNTANLSINSLHKRAITWAQGTGCLGAGVVAGSPL